MLTYARIVILCNHHCITSTVINDTIYTAYPPSNGLTLIFYKKQSYHNNVYSINHTQNNHCNIAQTCIFAE